MNGLKYIRTRCNYSQRALAEVLGVSRQAVNMWENSKKIPSKERKEDLCLIFGIDNPEYLGELTDELQQELKELPIYKVPFDGDSERFAFKPIKSEDLRYKCKHIMKYCDEQLSLDEQCTLKRSDLKMLLDDINNYAIEGNTKNSFNNLSGMNRALQIFGRTLDAAQEARNKHPEYVMVYFHTILAILDAMNISFGTVDENDVLYCKELKDVVISENLSVIPPFAFSNSGIEKIDIPNNITVIGMNAFANTLLKEIELPPDLQTIKINAFRDCSSIQKITIHSNATTIENILYYTPATIYCAAGSEAQKYAREHGLKMVQIDSVPKPAKRENLVSTILITFVDCVLNSRSGISQAYFPTWVKNIIGGYNISHWHWQSGKSNWGMQIYSTKPYTLSEAQEIKRKIENHSQNLSIRIELKTFSE